MADISKIKIGNLILNIKDAVARKIMKAATATEAGQEGLVPAPPAGAQGKFFRGDGTWQTPPDTIITYGAATQSVTGLMSAADKRKLDGIATGANAYSHPANHAASMITQDATHRFVSDTEKNAWNAKAGTGTASQNANGLMSAADKKKLDGIASGANAYSHPANHAASMITQDATHRFVSDTEKNAWNAKAGTGTASQNANGLMSAADKKKLDGIASGANAYTHPSTHAASMITQDATHRFVSDTEKTTWNNMTRIVYTGWGSSLSIPWGRGIHGIVVVDWRVVYVVCVQGNPGSRNLNKGIVSVTYSESGATGVNFSFNQSTNVLSCTTSAGGSTSIMYMGI